MPIINRTDPHSTHNIKRQKHKLYLNFTLKKQNSPVPPEPRFPQLDPQSPKLTTTLRRNENEEFSRESLEIFSRKLGKKKSWSFYPLPVALRWDEIEFRWKKCVKREMKDLGFVFPFVVCVFLFLFLFSFFFSLSLSEGSSEPLLCFCVAVLRTCRFF